MELSIKINWIKTTDGIPEKGKELAYIVKGISGNSICFGTFDSHGIDGDEEMYDCDGFISYDVHFERTEDVLCWAYFDREEITKSILICLF